MSKKLQLHQFLSQSGLFSSKKELIETINSGRITIDGVPTRQTSFQFNPNKKEVCLDGKPIKLNLGKIYIIMNKPKGYLSSKLTQHDYDMGKKSIFEILTRNSKFSEEELNSLNAVGRLDEDAEGLIIITNDGEMINRIANPGKEIEKSYYVKLISLFNENTIRNIEEGVEIKLEENGRIFYHTTKPAKIEVVGRYEIILTISEGKKREVKRIFEALGNKVIRLIRISIGNLRLDNLKISEGDYIIVEKEFFDGI